MTMFKEILRGVLPRYDPQKVVTPYPIDYRVKMDTKSLIKEFEARLPEGVATNLHGQTSMTTQKESGLESVIMTPAMRPMTSKNGVIQRVSYLTDFDKALIAQAGLDPLRGTRCKVHWATLHNGKHLTNLKISKVMKEDGMGERNVATYASLFSQAVELEKRHKLIKGE